MMSPAWIAAVCVFAVAMAATPGPNNTMLAASGANHGFRRTLPHIAGIALGVTVLTAATTLLGAPLASEPDLHGIVKWLGAAYLAWLAWKIGSAPVAAGPGRGSGAAGRPLTWVQAALFQVVNPKLWAACAGAVAAYGSSAHGAGPDMLAVAFTAIFAVATAGSTVLWTMIGVGAGRTLRSARAMRLFNRAMAALLLLSLVPVIAG